MLPGIRHQRLLHGFRRPSNYATTTLDGDFTINSLTFNANAAGPFTIGSGSPLAYTLTMQAAAASLQCRRRAATIAAPLALGAAQSWTNNSSGLLTASGNVINGSLSDGSLWVQNSMNGYVQWAKANKSLLVMTFDQDDNLPARTVVEGIKRHWDALCRLQHPGQSRQRQTND